MSRVLSPVVAALCALALLGGCGDDGDSATTTTTTSEAPTTSGPAEAEPEGTDVQEWAETFCADLATWREVGDPDVEDLDPESPEAAQAAGVEFLEALAQETDALIASTEALGPPATADGEAFVDALLERFEGVSSAVTAARDRVEALPTDDPTAFQAGAADAVAGVQDQINLFAASFPTVDETFDDPELQAALVASCT